MRIDTEIANDDQMAICLQECLKWLSDKGRDGARLLAQHITEDDNLEEAVGWIDDIIEGKEI